MKRYRMIWLDMDGVLVDFIQGANQRFQRIEAHEEATPDAWIKMGCETDSFWDEVQSLGSDFWANLPGYSTNEKLITWARSNAEQIGICTAPPRRFNQAGKLTCLQGKSAWLAYHALADLPLTYTRDKHVVAHPHAALIDDLPGNCRAFQAAGGHPILFSRPWNTNNPDLNPFSL